MKISKVRYRISMVLTLLSLSIWIIGCEEPDFTIMSDTDPTPDQTAEGDWVAFLNQLDVESSIIVPNESSIQDAVDAAEPGDAIYIEPGKYDEQVTVDNSNIQLIGLSGENGEAVTITNLSGIQASNNVEIVNIQHPDLIEKSTNSFRRMPNKRRRLLSMNRSKLQNGIAHYQFVVDLGSDEFDVVRIHRVVRERRPYRPTRTDGAVFMIHGSGQNFDDIFLRPGVDQPDAQNSSPFYLASNNIDVWGIDLAWTLVPEETNDFTFMQDWGVERDVDHTLKAMAIARLVRGLTRQGFDRMNLLGFSYGVSVAYAAAGRETQQHRILRDIKGIVAADGFMKYAPEDEAFRISSCDRAAAAQEQINNGVYQNSNGIFFRGIGDLAVIKPEEPSATIPWLNNYQAALFLGIAPPANPPAPSWHFIGGELRGNPPIPGGLLYTKSSRWIQLLRGLPPYQPRANGRDTNVCACNEEEVTIDDHLIEITVPILYLGVAGGFGQQGLYTSSLTSSTDITDHIVSLRPQSRAIDYGHADLFMGEDAAELAWDVLLEWLVDHSHRLRA
ncbi:MAG: hypothetical protein ACR2MX_01510 [Cyclobacteriaceae bacterium]